MQVISFLSQKGGSGKSTLAIHTAVEFAYAGKKVAIIDSDPQQSAVAWGEARDKDFPVVAMCSAGRIEDAVEAARADDFDIVIIDAAPHLDPAIARIAGISDFIAIPVRPTALDLQTAHRAAAVASASGRRFGFVLNSCPPRAIEVIESRPILEELGGSVCPQTIGERRAFARALGSGEAVAEFDPKGKAAAEIVALSSWLERQLANKGE
ncbi:MAG: ParA family protein [Betaproteobacteria bacterium]